MQKFKHYGFAFHITQELFQTGSSQHKNVFTNSTINSPIWKLYRSFFWLLYIQWNAEGPNGGMATGIHVRGLTTLVLSIQMPVILTFFNTRDLYSRVLRTPTGSDDFFQIMRSTENHKKGLKDNYEHLIDFLSHISKLSYLNLLDLADFFMQH